MILNASDLNDTWMVRLDTSSDHLEVVNEFAWDKHSQNSKSDS